MNVHYEIITYEDAQGKVPWVEWIDKLKDAKATLKIITRLQRMSSGNFGDHKSLGEGLWELRIDYGPGYRVYYCLKGKYIILLLCGGDKRTQSADIQLARSYKADYERRA